MKRSLLQFDDDFIQFNKLKVNASSLYQNIIDSIVDNCLKTDKISNDDYQLIMSMYNNHQILYGVQDKDTLIQLIYVLCENIGNDCNLNWLDTSAITDMSAMFINSKFNGDISEWDVSNVKNMGYMFAGSKFNGDISEWDVSNVTNMFGMFDHSVFNGGISKWNVSHVNIMSCMFENSVFNGNISKWDVSNVKDMDYMFISSRFNKNISRWNVENVKKYTKMFNMCPIKEKYKPNFIKK